MAANVSFNPVLTTVASGTFFSQSEGYIQGTMLDDPAVRYALAGGTLDSGETLPMWGGIGVFEKVPGASGGPDSSLGSLVGRAASIAVMSGFSVFNQASNWITSPQSQAPSAGVGMGVPFFRFGSGARIAVKCDPGLASFEGGYTNAQVGWNFAAQELVPYVASAETVTSITWAANVGTVVMAAPSVLVKAAGDVVTIAGATNSGTGGAGAVNSTFTVATFTDSTHFTLAMPAATGVIATIAGSPTLVAPGLLPVNLLALNIGNSQTIDYDATNNFVNWNKSGSTAIILL